MKMKLGFEFADLKKVTDGWVGMVRAFKAKLREDVETDTPTWVIINVSFGCAILMFVLTITLIVTLSASLWQVWKFFKRVLLETVLQRQLQPTNEISPPL